MLSQFSALTNQKSERVKKLVQQMDELMVKLQDRVNSDFNSLQQVDQAQEDITKIQSTYKIICSVLKNKNANSQG